MTSTSLALLYLAAVNPARLWPAVPVGDRGRRVAAAAVAAGLAAATVAGLAAGADAVVDALDAGPEMIRVAAGGVLLLTAGRTLVTPSLRRHPALPGWRAGLVPLAFPGLVSPELALLALAAATHPDAGEAAATLAALPALVAAVAVAAVPERHPAGSALAAGLARLLAGLQAALAVVLTVDGIRAI